ncbi:hypothetical protein [Qipengyuania flava]|uniref:hypothetical protein n=1 Tax=Qipengyuania flava TaxID=192812 RepID=UPI001CD53499|nr:hypothetical protein [Qipengyuania flava]MCA0891260.1 hypothetical protein [Qipengyuania flava]
MTVKALHDLNRPISGRSVEEFSRGLCPRGTGIRRAKLYRTPALLEVLRDAGMARRRTSKVRVVAPAHVKAMGRRELAQKLVRAREATIEYENAYEYARAAVQVDRSLVSALERLKTARENHPCNDVVKTCVPDRGDKAREAEKMALERYRSAKRKAGKAGITIAELVRQTGLHESTIRRYIEKESAEEYPDRRCWRAVVPPDHLMRKPHAVLAEGMALEREYIRALRHAITVIGETARDAWREEKDLVARRMRIRSSPSMMRLGAAIVASEGAAAPRPANDES